MKDIARSRTTYYSLAREILIKKHPKIFNFLLILALISMTGLAVFLISDILSFGSNSSYKGALAGLDLLEKGKSILKNDQGLLAANNSDDEKGNLSEMKNLSRQSGAPGPSSLVAHGQFLSSKSDFRRCCSQQHIIKHQLE